MAADTQLWGTPDERELGVLACPLLMPAAGDRSGDGDGSADNLMRPSWRGVEAARRGGADRIDHAQNAQELGDQHCHDGAEADVLVVARNRGNLDR